MSNSDYNKIVSAINSVSEDYIYSPPSNNLICIDTSNNRIGINTMDPEYSISIINHSTNKINSANAISTPKLYITEISNINIVGETMSGNFIYNKFEIYCDSSGYLRMRDY